jgi:hypothetical protein
MRFFVTFFVALSGCSDDTVAPTIEPSKAPSTGPRSSRTGETETNTSLSGDAHRTVEIRPREDISLGITGVDAHRRNLRLGRTIQV